MQRIFLTVLLVLLMLGGTFYYVNIRKDPAPIDTNTASTTASVIADHLQIPWDIAVLPDTTLLVTERPGNLVHIDPSTGGKTSISISTSTLAGEGGLLGIVLHPQFESNSFLYLYMTVASGTEATNQVVRYRYANNTIIQERLIIEGIPAGTNHDGGRLAFGPDAKLYISTGDATHRELAQATTSLAGKILRLNDDGTIPSDNPFGNAVWSYGHRNPQGLAWDSEGNLWETEHGPSGEAGSCCHDEINRIEKGANYGWPVIIGDETKDGMRTPEWNSGNDTWAPASLVYFNGSLYFGGLTGQALYQAPISNGHVESLTQHLKGIYGRIRTVHLGPGRIFYLTTSNTDGRGTASAADDRIIRVDPSAVR